MPRSFSALCRPTYARWLNERSFRPPMSVTRPTLIGLPLLAVVLDVVELELDVELLLEPQAATVSASAAHPASASARNFMVTVLPSSWDAWVSARDYNLAASAVFTLSSQNAASMAVAVTALRRSSSKPIRSRAISYSPPIDAPKYGGSSLPSVMRTPASASWSSGCASYEENTPSTTLLVGQHSSVIPRSTISATSAGSSIARTPWLMRVIGSSSAARTLSGPAHSPACIVQPSPASAAIA